LVASNIVCICVVYIFMGTVITLLAAPFAIIYLKRC